MYEGIEYRGFGQEIVEELAKYAGVPVWNGLTNEDHPTQMLADLLTIREHLGCLKGLKLVYMGDARYNMGNSLMIACTKMGMHFVPVLRLSISRTHLWSRNARPMRRPAAVPLLSQSMWRKRLRERISLIRMCGYPWVSLTRYGRRGLRS